MSLDQFFDRKYHEKRFNCLHHASEVWSRLTGEDIRARLEGVLGGLRRRHLRAFIRLSRPQSPCLVMLRRRRECVFHIGVYLDGRVMHITGRGVEYQPLDVVACGFGETRWYR